MGLTVTAMKPFPFCEIEATQAAAWLLNKEPGRRMDVVKLSKLLYLADREALKRWGLPIIGGRYCNMEHGPVVSRVVDAMKPVSERKGFTVWDEHLKRKEAEMVLIEDPGRGRLHDAAIGLLDETFARYGAFPTWELRDRTHSLPEYQDPGTSSLPIRPEVLLRHLGKSDEEIEELAADSKELEFLANVMGS
jgi:uncharacterized phage-associated protein